MNLYIVTTDKRLHEFQFVSSVWNSFHDGDEIIIVNYYDIYDKYHSIKFLHKDIISMEIIL